MKTRTRPSVVPKEGVSWVSFDGRFDAPLLISALPPAVPFGFLGRLFPTSTRGELTMQLHRIPSAEALEMLHSAAVGGATELEAGTTVAGARPAVLRAEVAQTEELADRLAAREEELWKMGVAFHAIGARSTVAEAERRALERRAAAIGFRTRVPEYDAARVARPRHFDGKESRPPEYWHTLATDGVAAFFPFVDESITEPRGILVGLLLDDAAPIFLNRWQHGSYSWGIFGATGSGKSFTAALIALRSRWMTPDLSLTIIDPLGEFTGLAGLLGGEVVTLGPNEPGRLNPLDPATTGGDVTAKASRVGVMLRALFPSLSDEESAVLDASVDQLYRSGAAEPPTFEELAETIGRQASGSTRLKALLDLFRVGPLRHLAGPTSVDLMANTLVVSLAKAEPTHLPFHLTYLLDAVYGRLMRSRGPKLVVVDEAHLLTHHAATIGFLDRIVRHVRHFDAGLIVLSQNPDDFLGCEAGRSLLRNLRSTLLLRLAEVSRATREFFDLTEAEADWLPRARLPAEAGYAEGLVRHGPSHLPLAIVASTPEFEFLIRAMGGGSPGASNSENDVPIEAHV